MAPARKTPRLRDGGGAITWVGLVLLLGVAAAAYLAWIGIPVYVVHYEVQQVVRQTGYAAAARSRDDAALLEDMTARIRALHEREAEGPDGRAVVRPAVDLKPEDVTWERNGSGTLRIAFEYEAEIQLPFLKRTVTRSMDVDMAMAARPDTEVSR